MPVLSTGTTFSATEQITSTKLNNIANAADFTDTSGNAVDSASSTGTCVNGGGIEVTTSGQLQIKDTEVTTAKIGSNAVTLAKMATQADQTVLGNVSGSTAVPSALPVVIGGSGDSGILFDNDDMLDNSDTAGGSATRGATQQSIKAFVTAMRPKFVALTSGTTNLTNERTTNGTTTLTYNIVDFTSSDSDFATSKIVGLVVSGFARQNASQSNKVDVSLPDGTEVTICSALAAGGGDNITADALTTVPINSDTTTFTIKLIVGNGDSTFKAESTIRGAIILPAL